MQKELFDLQMAQSGDCEREINEAIFARRIKCEGREQLEPRGKLDALLIFLDPASAGDSITAIQLKAMGTLVSCSTRGKALLFRHDLRWRSTLTLNIAYSTLIQVELNELLELDDIEK